MNKSWVVERATGSAAVFHAQPLPEPVTRTVWVFDVDRPALVLGSTQRDEVVDRDETTRAGIEVVRRRSGGGAVLLEPGGATWIDVVVPADDPLWDDDVGRSFHWLGDVWRDALAAFGIDGAVHRDRPMQTRWSELVCFAGLGAGEVVVRGGAKVLGMSQRRTRAGARLQTTVLHDWSPRRFAALLALPSADRVALANELTEAVQVIDAPPDAVAEAFLDRLRQGG